MVIISPVLAQNELEKEIKRIQIDRYYDDKCLDFPRKDDLKDLETSSLQQIIVIRHGEPALDKKGWKTREEAIRYTEMYDSVGVFDFTKKPICFRINEPDTVYTSLLPRAINTAEKTFDHPIKSKKLFNEFERKVINFPDIYLPRQFWSVSTRLVWMMGFNDKGIESFSEAKKRSRDAAVFLDNDAQKHGKTVLFAHGFLNKYIRRYLKKMGYKVIDMDGQKYLGAYYFYKVK